MASSNGTKSMLQTVITSVVIASLLSAGGAAISVSVMGSDLKRAQSDLEEAEQTITSNREELIGLKAAKKVADQRDDERWEDVKDELIKIRTNQAAIQKAVNTLRRR